jgi:hypothetical protein
MTQISPDHVEWTVIRRFRLMLEEMHPTFNVSHSYALFQAILCWVVQHSRMKSSDIRQDGNKVKDMKARSVAEALQEKDANQDPWYLSLGSEIRVEQAVSFVFSVPPPVGFEGKSLWDVLVALRDAIAHGDARTVEPFNVGGVIAGFTFKCAEDPRKGNWTGQITLLEQDMRRIGIELAEKYCQAVRHKEKNRRDGHFEHDAKMIKEC